MKYTKRQIVEAIRHWERQLNEMTEPNISVAPEEIDSAIAALTTDETETLDESVKNTILGWFGVKSNMTDIEDLIDLMVALKLNTSSGKEKIKKVINSLKYHFLKFQKERANGKIIPRDRFTLEVTNYLKAKIGGKNWDSHINKNATQVSQYRRIMEKIVNWLYDLYDEEGGKQYRDKANKQRERDDLRRAKEAAAKKARDEEEAKKYAKHEGPWTPKDDFGGVTDKDGTRHQYY